MGETYSVFVFVGPHDFHVLMHRKKERRRITFTTPCLIYFLLLDYLWEIPKVLETYTQATELE